MKLAVQLYSFRYSIEKKGLKAVLEDISKAGYSGVEFAGNFGGFKAEELKEILDKLNLTAMGAHFGLDIAEDGRFETETQRLKTLGVKYAVIPWIDLSAERKEAAKSRVLKACEKLDGKGFISGYHNHSFEFEGGDFIADLLEAGVNWEADVFWLKVAGKDVLEYLRSKEKSLKLLHIKELSQNGPEAPNPVVGEGVVSAAEVLLYGKSIGLEWAVLEAENLDMPDFEYLKKSAGFMNKYI